MKRAYIFVVTSLIFLPVSALASFSLSSISEINCVDASPSPVINMSFTTNDQATQKYTRRADDIPYDYGNLRSPYGNWMSGTMILANAPDADGGVILLLEKDSSSSLSLRPTSKVDIYDGVLSGQAETAEGRQPLLNHPMKCTVAYF